MLHACFTPIHICFAHTSLHFYTFSGTNLLTRCHSASSLFSAVFVFQKSCTGNILGIGRNKSQSQYFTVTKTKSEGETKRSHRGAKPPLGAARPGPAPRHGVAHPGGHRHRPSAYLFTISGKLWRPEPPSTKSSVAVAIAEPISGGSEALPGTLPEGEIITGGLYIAMSASELMRE